ncbi:MAG TPA: hypothetical protein VFV97_15465 [Rhodanobacteraceae bacterium]|nr:hypothetical protein [Rhodanobacteraceae bacterium]
MDLSKRRTIAMWIGVSSLAPCTVFAVTFSLWLDANARWLFPRRRWPASPLDQGWVWVTALAITLALLVIGELVMPKYWHGRRDALNSPIEDETHILRVDGRRDANA